MICLQINFPSSKDGSRKTMKAAELQKEVDRMARELRLLDNLLQQTNWTREMIE